MYKRNSIEVEQDGSMLDPPRTCDKNRAPDFDWPCLRCWQGISLVKKSGDGFKEGLVSRAVSLEARGHFESCLAKRGALSRLSAFISRSIIH